MPGSTPAGFRLGKALPKLPPPSRSPREDKQAGGARVRETLRVRDSAAPPSGSLNSPRGGSQVVAGVGGAHGQDATGTRPERVTITTGSLPLSKPHPQVTWRLRPGGPGEEADWCAARRVWERRG